MTHQKKLLLICAAILLLSILACTIHVGGPTYPSQEVPVSTAAAVDLESAVQTAVAAESNTGKVTLVITEAQLTSYLAARLQTESGSIFTNPQVYLRDGQIRIYGTVHQGNFQVTSLIVVTAGVDSQGQLKIELTSADFGPLPVPAGLKNIITAGIQEAYTGAIGPAAVGFRLESITVADGTMTIVGQTK